MFSVLFKKSNRIWLFAFGVIIIVAAYWSVLASDRYVSEANIVLESPQLAMPSLDISSILNGGGSNGDMLLLRDYLLSVDMLKELDAAVDFREHYSNSDADFLTRLSNADAPMEELHEYFLKRVSVELDSYANILRVQVEAFSPEKAHEIATVLLAKGEAHMNLMGQRLAEEQVKFLEVQVEDLVGKFDTARQELLDYQNKNGLVSPTGTVESINAVVSGLEGQLSSLQARRKLLLSFQSVRSPEIIRIESEIKALSSQIDQEQARMATQSGAALNQLSSEYQTLELKAQFAQESYSSALSALQATRIEAARKLKQVSILQSPTLPEYPQRPQRLYNIAVFAVVTLFITLIINMLIMIVRDHRD